MVGIWVLASCCATHCEAQCGENPCRFRDIPTQRWQAAWLQPGTAEFIFVGKYTSAWSRAPMPGPRAAGKQRSRCLTHSPDAPPSPSCPEEEKLGIKWRLCQELMRSAPNGPKCTDGPCFSGTGQHVTSTAGLTLTNLPISSCALVTCH